MDPCGLTTHSHTQVRLLNQRVVWHEQVVVLSKHTDSRQRKSKGVDYIHTGRVEEREREEEGRNKKAQTIKTPTTLLENANNLNLSTRVWSNGFFFLFVQRKEKTFSFIYSRTSHLTNSNTTSSSDNTQGLSTFICLSFVPSNTLPMCHGLVQRKEKTTYPQDDKRRVDRDGLVYQHSTQFQTSLVTNRHNCHCEICLPYWPWKRIE